jgi:hypothetical protein
LARTLAATESDCFSLDAIGHTAYRSCEQCVTRSSQAHPAAIPRTPPFIAVRQRVDNSMTCPASSLESAEIRRKHVRNVEVGGSSPLTST